MLTRYAIVGETYSASQPMLNCNRYGTEVITKPECRSGLRKESTIFAEAGAGAGVGYLNENRTGAGAGVRISVFTGVG